MNNYRTHKHRMKGGCIGIGMASVRSSGEWVFPLYNDRATRSERRLSAVFTCLDGFKKAIRDGGLPAVVEDTGRVF